MKKNHQYVFLVLALLLHLFVFAQESSIGFHYTVGVPLGKTADFINVPSYKGGSVEYIHIPYKYVGFHIEAGASYFTQSLTKSTYQFRTLTVTGTQNRYNTMVHSMVGIHYLILPDAVVIPYVALGAGPYYTEQVNEVGVYSIRQAAWMVAIKAEAGVAMNLTDNSCLKISARYYQAFKNNRLDAQSLLGMNIGYAYRMIR
jgi:opacity protein-like surface antigen